MLILLLAASVLQLLFLAFFVWGNLRVRQPRGGEAPPLSVIIAAKDEAENLQRNLPHVFAQDFEGEWELIVVLDRCQDGSKAVLERFAQMHRQLRWVEVGEIPEGWSPKKYALQQGISQAKHPHLAFTDADCRPEPRWLRGIAAAFASGADLVLGQGPMQRRPGLLNALVRFETWMTAVLYTGMAGWGRPYMGVGRNIAYTRAFFGRAGGFGAHRGRLSGDDDLLVNRAGRDTRTRVLTGAGTRVYSDAPARWGDWIRQKLRHHSAAPAYSLHSKLILASFHGLHAIFYLSLMLALFFSSDPAWGAVIWGCRAVIAAFLGALTAWTDRNDLILLAPLLDALYLLYLIIIGPAGMILPPKWKGK